VAAHWDYTGLTPPRILPRSPTGIGAPGRPLRSGSQPGSDFPTSRADARLALGLWASARFTGLFCAPGWHWATSRAATPTTTCSTTPALSTPILHRADSHASTSSSVAYSANATATAHPRARHKVEKHRRLKPFYTPIDGGCDTGRVSSDRLRAIRFATSTRDPWGPRGGRQCETQETMNPPQGEVSVGRQPIDRMGDGIAGVGDGHGSGGPVSVLPGRYHRIRGGWLAGDDPEWAGPASSAVGRVPPRPCREAPPGARSVAP
jgi:hypothetical protein